MKLFIKEHIIPFCFSLSIVFLMSAWYWHDKTKSANLSESKWNHEEEYEIDRNAIYASYAGSMQKKWNIAQALSSKKAIVLFGSSELTSDSPYLTGSFFRDSLHCSLVSIGHAGNQCMSILSQLMAFDKYNQGARIAIIVSPGWFMDHYANGTALQPFLEYNDVEMLNTALRTGGEYTLALVDYALKHADDFNGGSVAIDIAMDARLAQSKPHQYVFNSISHTIKHIFQRRKMPEYIDGFHFRQWPADSVRIVNEWFWKNLEIQAAARHTALCSNNAWGVSNDYYNEYLRGNKKRIVPVDLEINQELKDFQLLVRYIKQKQMDAVFILQPLNPLAYENLQEGDNTIDQVVQTIQQSEYPLLNLYTSDSTRYEKPLLNDVMHFGDYGFLKMNRFIYEHYVAMAE